MKINKKAVTLTILILWAIFSLGYIIFNECQKFQTEKIQVAFNQGYATAVNDLYTAAKKCQAVPVKTQTETIQVVDVSCLQQAAKTATGTPAEASK